jgi:hypothetical protein
MSPIGDNEELTGSTGFPAKQRVRLYFLADGALHRTRETASVRR